MIIIRQRTKHKLQLTVWASDSDIWKRWNTRSSWLIPAHLSAWFSKRKKEKLSSESKPTEPKKEQEKCQSSAFFLFFGRLADQCHSLEEQKTLCKITNLFKICILYFVQDLKAWRLTCLCASVVHAFLYGRISSEPKPGIHMFHWRSVESQHRNSA